MVCDKQGFDYNAVPGDYQYRALTAGPRLQRFWHRHKLELLSRVVWLKATDTILEVGCGSGNLLFHASAHVNSAYGFDISKEAIRFCRERAASENLVKTHLFLASANRIPLPDAVIDCVILAEVIEHLRAPLAHLNELSRVLRPGGQMFITTPNYGSLWPVLERVVDWLNLVPKMRNEQHITRLRKTELESLLETAGFVVQRSGTFYALSPLAATISERLAAWLFAMEINMQTSLGLLLYCVAEKAA